MNMKRLFTFIMVKEERENEHEEADEVQLDGKNSQNASL